MITTLINRYEIWWEWVRMPVLLTVGALICGFAICMIVGMIRSYEGWKR